MRPVICIIDRGRLLLVMLLHVPSHALSCVLAALEATTPYRRQSRERERLVPCPLAFVTIDAPFRMSMGRTRPLPRDQEPGECIFAVLWAKG